MAVADTTDVVVDDVMIDPVNGEIIDQEERAQRLLALAKEQGVSLTGPGGLLSQLPASVLETALHSRPPLLPWSGDSFHAIDDPPFSNHSQS